LFTTFSEDQRVHGPSNSLGIKIYLQVWYMVSGGYYLWDDGRESPLDDVVAFKGSSEEGNNDEENCIPWKYLNQPSHEIVYLRVLEQRWKYSIWLGASLPSPYLQQQIFI